MFNIVLHEPEKPDNTGNIGRTCVATGSALHLIYPIGFQLTRKNIHHAGLDYWERLKLFKHDNYDDFLNFVRGSHSSPVQEGSHSSPIQEGSHSSPMQEGSHSSPMQEGSHSSPIHAVGASYTSANEGSQNVAPVIWFATTKAHKSYTDMKFNDGDYIMFGKESAGIPEEILAAYEEHCIRIPMIENERSLNLSNSVAIVLYEALRQNNFNGMMKKGELHRLSYKH